MSFTVVVIKHVHNCSTWAGYKSLINCSRVINLCPSYSNCSISYFVPSFSCYRLSVNAPIVLISLSSVNSRIKLARVDKNFHSFVFINNKFLLINYYSLSTSKWINFNTVFGYPSWDNIRSMKGFRIIFYSVSWIGIWLRRDFSIC